MSYHVTYKGLEVVVDNLDELDALAERQAKGSSTSLDLRLNGHNKGTPQAITIKGLMSGLSPNAKKALKAIVKNGGRMNDTELAKTVHAKNNMALAGKLMPLYRAARRAEQNDLPLFFQKEVTTNEGGQPVTEYFVTPEALNDIREGLRV